MIFFLSPIFEAIAIKKRGASIRFSVFGSLFEEAIELGLPAIQTQHPGFYYQYSATHSLQRKKTCLQDHATLDFTNISPLPYLNSYNLDFYGQRPWRPNRLSLEPSDMKLELDGIAGQLIKDCNEVDHTVRLPVFFLLVRFVAKFCPFVYNLQGKRS